MDEHETFILNVTKISREGRRAGATELFFIGYLNVELGLLCTDEDDIGEFNEMHGPLCWQGCERDHGGFKKLMWYGITKESNCKVTSTWSDCGREKEMAFTHPQLGDYIVGAWWKSDETYIYNDEKYGTPGTTTRFIL